MTGSACSVGLAMTRGKDKLAPVIARSPLFWGNEAIFNPTFRKTGLEAVLWLMGPRLAERRYFVYIMTNFTNTVLYTGVTNDLIRRVSEHRSSLNRGFTARYHVTKLVYFETYSDPVTAIAREKQIKAGPRKRKIDLVNRMNPTWGDLG